MRLNRRALGLCQQLIENADDLRIAVYHTPGQARVLDCGVDVPGGLEAGRRLAEICLSGLGQVELFPGGGRGRTPEVSVRTDQPVAACMASQYAGWQIKHQSYFAMGSGPMRAAAGREPLFDVIGYRESDGIAVGVLESSRLPPPEVCREIAEKCRVEPNALTLLVAPTASQAGTIQVVARAVNSQRLEIVIEDDGVGLSEGDLADVRRFVPGGTSKVGGTGFGLPTARRMIGTVA